jgi:hypothetical protein
MVATTSRIVVDHALLPPTALNDHARTSSARWSIATTTTAQIAQDAESETVALVVELMRERSAMSAM